MRHALIACLLAPTLAVVSRAADARPAPEPEPLWEAELSLGYGISKRAAAASTADTSSDIETSDGTSASSSEMTSASDPGRPLSFAALAAIAINQEPRVFAYGGLVGETLARDAIGVTSGGRLTVPGLPLRVSGGGVWMVAPKTLWGATASAGACLGRGTIGVCGDIQLTAYVAGTALPKDELELQAAFVLGFVARGGM